MRERVPFEYELASLDLGQVKHVIDESEQVLAVGLKPFEYAKHILGRLAISAVRHQFGVIQDSGGLRHRDCSVCVLRKQARLPMIGALFLRRGA